MEVEVLESPERELLEFFEKQIEAFNLERWEVKERKPLAIRIRNARGEVVGGAAARTFGLWLLIDNLWVGEELRGQDMGTRILADLERAAVKRGCKFALLDTLNFQAKPFYEKFGYQVKWTQQSYPKEGCKYFMVKELACIREAETAGR